MVHSRASWTLLPMSCSIYSIYVHVQLDLQHYKQFSYLSDKYVHSRHVHVNETTDKGY